MAAYATSTTGRMPIAGKLRQSPYGENSDWTVVALSHRNLQLSLTLRDTHDIDRNAQTIPETLWIGG